MNAAPSMTNRVLAGKATGFAIGLALFLAFPAILPEADPLLRWGVLLWYGTLGGLIGMAGLFSRHPVLLVPLPWWLRGSLIGAWMNLVLTFFAHEALTRAMAGMFPDGPFVSPFWFVLEGALAGLIIAAVATAVGGEGPASARDLPD